MKHKLIAAAIASIFLWSSEEISTSSTTAPVNHEPLPVISKNQPSLDSILSSAADSLDQAKMDLISKAEDCQEKLSQMANLSLPNYFYANSHGFLQLQTERPLLANRPDHGYGTPELVNILRFASDYIYSKYGVTLQAFDLSRERGGRLPPHKSHNRGLDADVGIYWYDGLTYGNSQGHLKSLDEKTLQINWDFIKALQDEGDIKFIFWSWRYIRTMEKYVVAKCGAEEWETYSSVLRGASKKVPNHPNHFHVRIKEWTETSPQYLAKDKTPSKLSGPL